MNTEDEKSTSMENYQATPNEAREDLVRAIVNCKVHKLMKWL
jgi:hypothetical protein